MCLGHALRRDGAVKEQPRANVVVAPANAQLHASAAAAHAARHRKQPQARAEAHRAREFAANMNLPHTTSWPASFACASVRPTAATSGCV
jgi:hypothetical protein